MSGKSIDKVLNKAYGKVATAIGYNFKLYRSNDYLTPVQDKNYLKDIVVAFSVDEEFSKTQGFAFSLYNIYCRDELLPGDILVSTQPNKRFTIVQNEVISQPYGINSFGTITIKRPSYTATGGFGPKEVNIATDIPATIIELSSESSKGNMTQASPYKTGIHRWDMWFFMPFDGVKLNDSIIDQNGNKSTITSIQYTPLGYKVTSVKV